MKILHLLLIIISCIVITGSFVLKDATVLAIGSSIRDNTPEASQEVIKEVSSVAENSTSKTILLLSTLTLFWAIFSSFILYRKGNDKEKTEPEDGE